MTPDDFTRLALSLDGVEEMSHFGKRDFRAGGKIFATLPEAGKANLKLLPDQQLMMLEMQADLFAALPKSWGARGWTSLDLALATEDTALAAIRTARENVLPKTAKKP